MTLFPGKSWSKPDATGWSKLHLDCLAAALAAGEESTAFAIVTEGRPVFAWGSVARPSSTASVRKSLISLLYGIEVSRGTVRLDADLCSLGINDRLGLSPREKQATVLDLLRARSGVYHPSVYDTARGRPERGAHVPGAHWFYNNWDFNVLGTILERATGRTLQSLFTDEIAAPLGFQDFEVSHLFLEHGPESEHAVYKIRLSARDLARVGLMMLREGKWQERQVVPRDWVRSSTRAHSALGGGRGYGLLWWTAQAGAQGDALACDWPLFYASGYGGQYLIVIPALDMVVVHRAARVDHGIDHARMGELLRMTLSAHKS